MRKVSTTLVLIFSSSLTVLAGNTGKVAGRITDVATKEALVGANVLIVGTTLGASADLDGKYAILNVPPGIYILRASSVGYASEEVRNLRVSIDLTTEMNFELSEAAVQTEAVVVTAERPLVQKDLTASTAVISDRDIQSLPITEFNDVLQLQAGVVAGHFRGGREGEVAYWIDGVPVTDAFNGETVVDVNKNSIQEMQLVTGAFNAEYGNAMSGIVNIATKSGSNDTHGNLTFYSGGHATSHSDIFSGLQTFKPLATQNTEASLNGPIFKDKLFYYLNVRYYNDDGYRFGIRKFNPWDITNSIDPNEANWKIQQTGDGAIIPLDNSIKGYAQAKLTYKASPDLTFSYNYIIDNTRGKSYNFGGQQDYGFKYKYNPDGMLSNFKKGYLNTFTMTHTLGASTFYTLGGSYFFRDFREYLDQNPFSLSDLLKREDPFDQRYVHTKLLTQPEGTFYTGGTDMTHNVRNTSTYVAKFDLTSQITNEHQVKVGFEFDQYRLFQHNINLKMSDIDNNRDPLVDGYPFLLGPVVIPSSETHDNLEYLHKPRQLSAYVQDKMEYKSLIVNFGLRFDLFHPDGQVLADPTDPDVYAPLKPQNQDSVVAPGGAHAQAVAARMKYWYKDATDKWQVSPRLGVSFPITDRGIVHFSYGLFFQIPSFERLYENPGYKLTLGGSTNLGIIGNPDLKPEQTTSGELGLQQQLTDDISVDITGYFRDIRNLAGTLNPVLPVFGGTAIYGKYENTDFGFVRGIVLSVDKRFSGGISATVDYTFQIAKGNASDPYTAFNLLESGTLPETQLIPLNWDQRHTVNLTLNYTSPANWGASFIFKFLSGTPYTPDVAKSAGTFALNSESKPTTYNLDFRAYKDFRIGSMTLSLFLRVNNVLDTKNATDVFTNTGLPDFSLDEQRQLEINPPQRISTVTDWYTKPYYYAEPRRIELGSTISF